MTRTVASAARLRPGIVALAAATFLNAAPAVRAAPAATAIARGDCATAINAGDYATITINCGLTARERRMIERLGARVTSLSTAHQALKRSDAQQTQALQALANRIDSLEKEREDYKAMIAAVFVQLKDSAAAPSASAETKQAALALAEGEVDPAIRLFGKQASAVQQTSAPDSTKTASDFYVQQAVLLQTRDLKAAQEATEKAIRLNPENSSALAMSAQLAFATGDFTSAIQQQQKAHDAAAARLAKAPDDTILQQEVAVARGGLGWFRLMSGELVKSREDLAASLAGFEKLVALDSSNPEWRRLQSVGYSTLADGQLAAGDAEGALVSLRRSLDLATDLVARFDSLATRYEIVGRLQKIGYVQSYMGKPVEASASFKSALGRLEPIIAANPEVDAGYSDQINILSQLAWLQLTNSEVGQAIEAFRKAVDISESRLKLSPSSPFWQRWVEIAHGSLGEALISQPMNSAEDMARIGQAAEASFIRASTLAESLAAQNPQNPIWQSDLWMTISRLAKVKVGQGKLQEALSLYDRGIPILERIVATNDANAGLHNALGGGYWLKADTLLRQGRRGDAVPLLERSVGEQRRAVELAPAAILFKRDLATAILARGQLTAASSPSAALPDLREGLRMRQELFATQPGNGLWEAETIFAQLTLANSVPTPAERLAVLKAARGQLRTHIETNRAPPFPPGMLESINAQIAKTEQTE